MSSRTYAIIGTGALGGYYGAVLHHAGCEVHFLLRSDLEHVKAHGLTVDSEKVGDLSIAQPHVYQHAEDMPACDVVMVCLKTTRNHVLPSVLPHVVKEDGVVVMMQNGLNVEEEAVRIVGADRVMSGLSFLCSNKVGPGHIHHMDYGQVRFGEYSAEGKAVGVTDRMRGIASDFERAGVPVELAEDLLLARWKKLVWNVPFNGLSVVLDARTDELMGERHTRLLCESLMGEVAAAAGAFDRRVDGAFIQQMLDHTDRMTPYRPSMKVDYDLGRPMEVEAIYGNTLGAASRAGVECPRIEMLYRQLKLLDERGR